MADAELQKLKTGADTYSEAIAEADNYTRWIIDLFRPHLGTTLLEVGLGHGGYRAQLPTDVVYLGTDIDADAVADAQRANPRDTYFVADIVSPDFPEVVRRHNPAVDTVLCANVLEHVADDTAAVQNLLHAAGEDGKLLLYLPAHQRLYGSMDELAGHHRRYDHDDLARLANDFTLLEWSYVNPIGAVGWWVNRKMRHRSLNEASINRQIRFFDRYVLPLSRAATPVTRRWFGLSLYCVLQKT